MANEEYLTILKQSVDAWNAARNEGTITPSLIYVDLSRADLHGMDLRGVDFHKVELHGANLTDMRIIKPYSKATDYRQAEIADADFTGVELSGANFGSAVLRDVTFSGALLLGVNFSSAQIERVEFAEAFMLANVFADNDLRIASGLESIQFVGPSTIGLDTIYKSRGKIPESFLRGCGVPESFITQMHSLVGAEDGIQFYSCFISYSSKDEEFARRLHGRMRDAHLRVWFAPEDMKSGQKLHEQIETAIRVYDKLLIVLSEASLQSEWVKTELRKAFKAEQREGERKLFPVRLVDMETIKAWECFDADSGKDLAVELREYFIPDFSNWKEHDSFETAFARLLKDLRADEDAK